MRKLLYTAVGLFILVLFAASGSNDKGTAVASKPKCVVTMDKFLNMKESMSYYQIERDVGCGATLLSSSDIGDIKTAMVSRNGTGSF